MAKRILLVDDEGALRRSLAEHLRLHEKFITVEVETGSRALEAAKNEYFDAILLDVGLPDMDGREVCRVLRRNGVKSPIVMPRSGGVFLFGCRSHRGDCSLRTIVSSVRPTL